MSVRVIGPLFKKFFAAVSVKLLENVSSSVLSKWYGQLTQCYWRLTVSNSSECRPAGRHQSAISAKDAFHLVLHSVAGEVMFLTANTRDDSNLSSRVCHHTCSNLNIPCSHISRSSTLLIWSPTSYNYNQTDQGNESNQHGYEWIVIRVLEVQELPDELLFHVSISLLSRIVRPVLAQADS